MTLKTLEDLRFTIHRGDKVKTGIYQSSSWADDSVMIKAINYDSKGKMNKLGRKGVDNLRDNTPKRSGQTANGWYYKLAETKSGYWELEYCNNAHPESPLNIAFLIDRGHFTRTGGYVPPTPFIYKSLESVMNALWFDIAKELII